MTNEEAKLVAGRVETVVDALAKTRMFVYKSIELFLISQLHAETSMDLDPSEDALEKGPLDLILDREHGATVVRNLVALVLNGSAEPGKGAKIDQETIRAQELAQSVYDNLREVLLDLKAMKGPSKVPLGIPQQALAQEIHAAIRTHFARLPEVIVSRVTSSATYSSPRASPASKILT